MPWKNISTDSELIAIHSALLPTEPDGVVLYYGDWSAGLGVPTDARRYRMAPDVAVPITTGFGALPTTDCFCGGQSFLADGRLLSAGGTVGGATTHGEHQHYPGERACWIYLPRANTWVPAADLHFQPDGDEDAIGGGRWYPTLATLANGEVLAVGGHPMVDDFYPRNEITRRHNNNTPERYSPGANTWALMTADVTAPAENSTDGYPRFHLLPNGLLFFDTAGKRDSKRFFDPYAGVWTGPDIGNLDTLPWQYAEGSACSSVLLPLQPPNYRPRILATNSPHDTAFVIELDESPAWTKTGERKGSAVNRDRENACATLLPTGQVLVTGGWPGAASNSTNPADATVVPELYTPGIDWATGNYSGAGVWETLEDDPAPSRRGYHSGALLLPDGRVWHGGSTTEAEDNLNIEVFTPHYADGVAGRPRISDCPGNIGYLHPFIVETLDAGSIARIALMRCGSITHGFDSDQRYVGLNFTHFGGDQLQVIAPPDPNIAPPGYYMLFLIDDQERVCERASFIRVSRQKLVISADISTFSRFEVDALGPTSTFAGALSVVFDGFMPHEVTPLSWEFTLPDGGNVPGVDVSFGNAHYEAGENQADLAQRVAIPVTLSFTSFAAFNEIPDDEDFITCTFRATAGFFSADTKLRLSKKQNPRMSDNEPPWLSIDLRVFKINPDDDFVSGIPHPSGADGAYDYIQAVLADFNAKSGQANHPFDALPIDQEAARLELGINDPNGDPVFNYAVARVRFVAPVNIEAVDVRLFFRLWTTGWSALEFNTDRNYRRFGDGPEATPLLGLQGGEISSFPCFAQPRKSEMQKQEDETNRLTLKGNNEVEVHGYFGCWLDINQENPLFPIEPQNDGPFDADDNPLSIQQLMRGLHQCLVAEIHYTEDVILPGDTPSSSDNLAQRNILFDYSDNPGSFAAHLVHHTFEFKPSLVSFDQSVLAPNRFGSAAARLHPDELAIDWGNLPRDALVTFYLPQLDAEAIVRASAARQSPGNLVVAGPHTIRCKVTDIGFIPLPGPLPKNIAGLITVQLPPGVPYGRTYQVVVRQVGGRELKVLGTTEFRIEVRRAEQIVGRLQHDLAVLKHIGLAIPEGNRWHPVFERYLAELADRIRAMGGDPDAVDPNPFGTGGPAKGGNDNDKDEKMRCVEGTVAALHYDCCGGFEGFTLSNCDGEWRFVCVKPCFEPVLLTAVREQMQVTVFQRKARSADRSINRSCPWSGRPVHAEAVTRYRGEVVGFCSPDHKDRFARAIAMFDAAEERPPAAQEPKHLKAKSQIVHDVKASVSQGHSTGDHKAGVKTPKADQPPAATAPKGGAITVNPRCPFSDKPVSPNATTHYQGQTVGFCSAEHRDQFVAAVKCFDELIDCSTRYRNYGPTIERIDLKP
jgi:YHS domain-containing protein